MTTFKLNTEVEQTTDSKKYKKKLQEDNNKPKRKRITPEQLKLLTESFKKTDTPSHDIRDRLAKKLNMTNREVQVWFQNRRAKVNRIKLLQEKEEVKEDVEKKTKFNYWSINNQGSTSPLIINDDNSSNSSSNLSSLSSSPSLLPNDILININNETNLLQPIDILATAAAYVQKWDEEQKKRKREQEDDQIPKKKSWRPWL